MPPKRSSLPSAIARPTKIAKGKLTGSLVGTENGFVDTNMSSVSSASGGDQEFKYLKSSFLRLFQTNNNVTNFIIKNHFGETKYKLLVPFINELLVTSRLTIERGNDSTELIYRLNSEEMAAKFKGLDQSHRLVLQIIENSGNRGIWTKEIRMASSLQEQALKKIYKALEMRKLIKPVNSVTAARKKLYMLYDLTPAREITGGPWYTEMEFDHEFIAELRHFMLHCIKTMNKGRGVTLKDISDKMIEMKVSRIQLKMDEVVQLMQTLVYDYLVEEDDQLAPDGMSRFVEAKKVDPRCDFKGWDVLSQDFHFQRMRFSDGVVLRAHEPHYHSA